MCRMLLVDPTRRDPAGVLRDMSVNGMRDDPPALREYWAAESRYVMQYDEKER
jgi:hypothetical protein